MLRISSASGRSRSSFISCSEPSAASSRAYTRLNPSASNEYGSGSLGSRIPLKPPITVGRAGPANAAAAPGDFNEGTPDRLSFRIDDPAAQALTWTELDAQVGNIARDVQRLDRWAERVRLRNEVQLTAGNLLSSNSPAGLVVSIRPFCSAQRAGVRIKKRCEECARAGAPSKTYLDAMTPICSRRRRRGAFPFSRTGHRRQSPESPRCVRRVWDWWRPLLASCLRPSEP